jgi:hypothetical protein
MPVRARPSAPMPSGVVVAHRTLDPMARVRVPARQPSLGPPVLLSLIILIEKALNDILKTTVAFRSSSAVERAAVNRLVVGSSPTCGARFISSDLLNTSNSH